MVVLKHEITIDVDAPDWSSRLYLVQGTDNEITLHIQKGGEPYDLTEIGTAVLVSQPTRRGSMPAISTATITEATNGVAVVKVLRRAFEYPGIVKSQLKLYGAENAGQLSSTAFEIEVEKSTDKDYQPAEDEMSFIEQNMVNVEVATVTAEDAAVSALNARDRLTGEVGQAIKTLNEDKAEALGEVEVAVGEVNEVAANNKTLYRGVFVTEAERDAAIPSPTHGITVTIANETTGISTTTRYVDAAVDTTATASGWVTVDRVNNPLAINQLNQQLAEKADDAEVRKKSVLIGLNDADADMLAAIQGGEGTTFELLSIPRDQSVTPEKTTFIEKSTNLFDKNNVVLGKRISPTGALADSADYGYSHPFNVQNGDAYYLVGVYEIAWYDGGDNFLSRIQAPTTEALAGWYATTPTNARIGRININTRSQYWTPVNKVQVSRSASPVPYEEHYYRLSDKISINKGNNKEATHLNVKDFGAVGNGVANDTTALKNAIAEIKKIGGGRLYIPKGTYMVSSTLVLPSNVTLFGDGMRLSKIKAITGTIFNLYKPLDSIHEKNYHRTMLTFESSGDDGLNTLNNLTENVHIQDLTFDWNFSPVNHSQYSIAAVLVDRAKQVTFERVKIANPIQQEDTKRLGSAIMFSFSNQCYMYNCELDKADYESLCVRFLSRDIHFINSTILDNFPTDRYTFLPSHYLQLARPSLAADELKRRFGAEMAGPLYVEGCHFEVNTDFASDLACVHWSRGFYFRNNYVKYSGNLGSGQTIVKPLDYAEDIDVSGNYFDWSEWGSGAPKQLPSLINIPRDAGHCKNIKFNNNIAKLNVPDSVVKFDNLQIIGINRDHNDNVEVKDNFVHLMKYPNVGFNIFGIMQGELSGNKILAENPTSTIDYRGPRGFFTFVGKDGEIGRYLSIKDNTIIASGKLGVGLEIKDANLTNGVFEGNDFADAVVGYMETTSTTGVTEKIKWHRFKDNIGVSLKSGTGTLVTGQTPALTIPLTGVKGINFDDTLIAKYNPTTAVPSAYKVTHSIEWTGTAFQLVFHWVTDPGVNVEMNYRVEVQN